MLKRLARALWPALPSHRANFERWLGCRRREARTIGFAAMLRLTLARWRRSKLASIRPAGHRHPLYFRANSSDPRVIDQVLVEREYECLAKLRDVEFIVDCGANIGCTSYYLLHRYPNARAIVVEPDEGNMALCRRNLAGFGDRITFVQAGVWSRSGDLVVVRGEHRDGAEWSFQVRLAEPGENPDVHAVSIAELMEHAGFPGIDALKIDIEGAEVEVFRTGAETWLPAVRNMAIELHDAECRRVVHEAMARHRYRLEHSGELTVFLDIAQCQPDAQARVTRLEDSL